MREIYSHKGSVNQASERASAWRAMVIFQRISREKSVFPFTACAVYLYHVYVKFLVRATLFQVKLNVECVEICIFVMNCFYSYVK